MELFLGSFFLDLLVLFCKPLALHFLFRLDLLRGKLVKRVLSGEERLRNVVHAFVHDVLSGYREERFGFRAATH